MATMHFKQYPFHRRLFVLEKRDIEGERFSNWEDNANYSTRITIILQLDNTNVSAEEKALEPEIYIVTGFFARLNVNPVFHEENVSFEEFQSKWAKFEMSLEKTILEKVYRLNAARKKAKGLHLGEWYINYGLNEKHIEVRRP